MVKAQKDLNLRSALAVHSHTRRARADGIEPEAIRQVALLAIGPLGLPRAVAAKTWIEDIDA